MDKSLRSNVNELSVTKSAIKLALRSPAGAKAVWAIVEGEDDVLFYGRMLDDDNVAVKIAEGDDGKNGYKNVETLVEQISKEEKLSRIFGIRDRDYTFFERPEHSFPDNIFVTDRRDLEMMLFESSSVISEMQSWTSCFTQVWSKVLPVARYIGYLRICNHINNYGCILREHIKPGKIWDFSIHDFIVSWKEMCASSLEQFISLEDVDKFVKDNELDGFSLYDICRGHDVIKLLSLALIQNEYNTKAIMKKMIDSYTLDDFRGTKLYGSIDSWQKEKKLRVLRS